MSTTWPWDAHFAAYSRPDVPHRLDSDSPGDTLMVLAVFDVDAPAKAATPTWFSGELPKVQALATAHPGVWVYPTRGGYRLLWRLPAPQRTRGWWRHVKAWLLYLDAAFGIVADPKCTDWTRLYRLPLVRRDGAQTTGAALQYGTGTWVPHVTVQDEPERTASAAAPIAPRPTAYAAVVALHFANPPCDDRNAHSMAFAAAGACLGASQERVAADLTSLLEASRADQRHVRAVDRIVERTFERVAEGEAVSWRPSAWRGTQLEIDLSAAWLQQEPDAPAQAAPPARAALVDLDIIGAPANVERALMRYRGRRDPDAPLEMKDSRAVIRWLVEVKQWSPAQVGAELGAGAIQVATEFAAPDVQNPGRLAQLDELLKPIDLRHNQLTLAIEVHQGGSRRDWTDSDTAFYRALAELRGISAADKPVPRGDIEERARARAEANAYHPVRDYLSGLRWDGQARLDQLWVRYFGATDCDVHRALGACFALGAVRRAVQPGTKVDLMPILYGDQGMYKSTAIKVLTGSDFYTDASPQFGHRSENTLTLTGCWIWEIPELEGFDRSEQNAIKAFVTRTEDHVLLPYARVKTRHRRHSVMLGTTNVEQCLKDPTGSRRHPVIAIGHIDLAALEADRDQLWAEALARAATAEPHWMAKAMADVTAQQNDRFQAHDDAWESALTKWFAKEPHLRMTVDGKIADRFSIADALTWAIGLPTERQGRAEQTRMGQALRRLGARGQRVHMPGAHHLMTSLFCFPQRTG